MIRLQLSTLTAAAGNLIDHYHQFVGLAPHHKWRNSLVSFWIFTLWRFGWLETNPTFKVSKLCPQKLLSLSSYKHGVGLDLNTQVLFIPFMNGQSRLCTVCNSLSPAWSVIFSCIPCTPLFSSKFCLSIKKRKKEKNKLLNLSFQKHEVNFMKFIDYNHQKL